MFETLRLVDVVVGLLGTAFVASAGILAWLHKRMRTVATEVAGETKAAQEEFTARIDILDGEVGRMRVQVAKVAMDVDRFGERLIGVEKVLERVALADHVNALRTDLAEFKGATGAKLDGVVGLLDTLYQAALRANQPSRREAE